MTAQATLELTPVVPEKRRPRIFADLNLEHPSFVIAAAQRIAALDDSAAVEAALAFLTNPFTRKMVETLAIGAMAMRIARLPDLEDRRIAMSRVPEGLLPRVAPLMKSYFTVKPWRYKRGAD